MRTITRIEINVPEELATISVVGDDKTNSFAIEPSSFYSTGEQSGFEDIPDDAKHELEFEIREKGLLLRLTTKSEIEQSQTKIAIGVIDRTFLQSLPEEGINKVSKLITLRDDMNKILQMPFEG